MQAAFHNTEVRDVVVTVAAKPPRCQAVVGGASGSVTISSEPPVVERT